MDKKMEQHDLNSLIEGVARAEYHLLLGAGASLGGCAKDGSLLPTADDLASELLSDFGVDTGGYKLDLKGAYEQVENLKDKLGRSRQEYLSDRFTGCTPSWQSILPEFRWNRIWSFNIDDIVETAYYKVANRKQTPKIIDWTDYYAETNRENNEIQIIHLHGYAPQLLRGTSSIVFSILEYLQATSKQHAWHKIFGDEFLQRPFVIVGARLSDEFDFADVVRRGNSARNITGRPSVIVLKEIPPFMKDNFEKWGLIPIEAPAEDFFSHILPKVRSREEEIGEIINGLNKDSLNFFNQFKWLKTDDVPLTKLNHDFYLGDDPLWVDITTDKDAIFDISTNTLDKVQESNNHKAKLQTVFCISGPPGSGKSTALLRISRELIKKGHDVFLFKGETRLNIPSAKWCLRTFVSPVLLFDGIADFASDVGRLLNEAETEKIPLLAIATERAQRMHYIYQGILATNLVTNGLTTEHLSDGDISRLVQKLETNKRLGKITRYSNPERIKYFRKFANRQLLVGMSELEGGKGFPNRIKTEYETIPNTEFRSIYMIACITYSIGYQLPVPIAASATGKSVSEIVSSISSKGALSGVLNIDGIGLKPRHRVIASLAIERLLDKQERFDLTLLLAKTLSPYITTRTISQKTIHYRIVRRLMDEELIHDWVGTLRSRAWYEELVTYYEWNARFWEQRALLESRLGHFPRARSYAEEAVRIQKHPFTLNTLGSILTRMSISYHNPTSREAEALFNEGIEILKVARDMRDNQTIHTYHTYFARTLSFVKLAYVETGNIIPEELKSQWDNWMKSARRSTIYSHSENLKELDGQQKEWTTLIIRNNFSNRIETDRG
jgi:hypothetical protein